MQNPFNHFYRSMHSLKKAMLVVAIFGVIVSGVAGSFIKVNADEIPKHTGEITDYPSLRDCSADQNSGFIDEKQEVGPCVTTLAGSKRIQYNCKRLDANFWGELIGAVGWQSGNDKKYAVCENMVGNSEPLIGYTGASNQEIFKKPFEYAETYCSKFEGFASGYVIKLQDKAKSDEKILNNCKGIYRGFCAFALLNDINGKAGQSANFCNNELKFNGLVPNSTTTDTSGKINIERCQPPTSAELAEIKKAGSSGAGYVENRLCKIADGGIYYCETAILDGKASNCIPVNKTAKDSAGKATNAGFGSGSDPKNVATVEGAIGGLFTIIYKIVAAIIMALLFLVRYLQMTVLLLFISVMTVLLNLSPNTGFLTTLAVPLWSIFAQIANLGAVGLLIFYGSATMIGIDGFEYDKTIAKGAQVAIYVFVSNFTYFGLAFAISLLDGFTKLIVFVFGGGSVFKLFEALIASVSSISKVGPGTSLIPTFEGASQAIGAVFGTATSGGGTGDVTTTLVKEIIVVIGLGLIIWVFGRIFFMLLTRVAILLLLLITSPIWVLGILVKDALPTNLQGQVTKAVELVSGTILFNFAFITTLVLVTIITQKINGGISEFQKGITDAIIPAKNTGLAFIDGVSANAQATGGVLSNDAFLGFGAGGFGDTISVCAVLGINLAIIYFAFDAIANLIDTNIQSVGKAVGDKVGGALGEFGKPGSMKKAVGGAFGAAGMAITGGGETTEKVFSGTAGALGMLGGQQSINGYLRGRANKSIDTNTDKNRLLQEKYDIAKASGNEKEMKKIKLDMNKNQAAIDYAKETVKSTRGAGRKNLTERLTDLGKGNVGADYIKSKTDQSDHQEIDRENKNVRYDLDKAQKAKNDGFIDQYFKNDENPDFLPDYLRGEDGKLDQRFVQKDSKTGEYTSQYGDTKPLPYTNKESIDIKIINDDTKNQAANIEAMSKVKDLGESIKSLADSMLSQKHTFDLQNFKNTSEISKKNLKINAINSNLPQLRNQFNNTIDPTEQSKIQMEINNNLSELGSLNLEVAEIQRQSVEEQKNFTNNQKNSQLDLDNLKEKYKKKSRAEVKITNFDENGVQSDGKARFNPDQQPPTR